MPNYTLDELKYKYTEVNPDTVIQPGKNYVLRFEYSNPHNYSSSVLWNNFEAIFHHCLPGESAGSLLPDKEEMNFSFIYPEHTNMTLRGVADQISDYAPNLGITLIFKKAEVVEKIEEKFPWWILLIGIALFMIVGKPEE